MSAPTPANKIQVASITDRGLSEKRPLNEDSLLADPELGIFVVCDGVGGADAGEVASRSAVEVLKEAFQHQLSDGEDVEDLMELAIQRANSSIYQMAAEYPRVSMMATTLVALHLDGPRATIGHVGDSRLYRLNPEGQLVRETADHSIVEEEVRAGRMTPEQAVNHPSKNVISRALGAEESVEVDMKTIEVGEGNAFLLCTDGITRHIPDNELRELLQSGRTVEAMCTEMKERCYQRGAEDNLTAIIVQVGTPPQTDFPTIDIERTISNETYASAAQASAATVETPVTPPPPKALADASETKASQSRATVNARRRPRGGSAVLRFFVFLLFIGVAGGAFYAGMRYQRGQLFSSQNAAPQPSPTTQPADAASIFEQKRSAVDSDPKKWLSDNTAAGTPTWTESKDPEFLYLYGRALMLTGNQRDATQAFELALNNLRTEPKANLPLDAEVKLAEAAAALKVKNQSPAGTSQEVLMAEERAALILDELLKVKTEGKAR
jgi:serine/threonine protein phosphatase PrpC